MSSKGTKPALGARLRQALGRRRTVSNQTDESSSDTALVPSNTQLSNHDVETISLPNNESTLLSPAGPSLKRAPSERSSTSQRSITASVMKRTQELAWASVKETLLRVKEASALRLPSLSQLLADISGFAGDLEEMEEAKGMLTSTAAKLDELVGLINELNVRFELSSDVRTRLEHINTYIDDRRGPLTEKMKGLKDRNYLKRAVAVSEVTTDIAKIVSDVHGDMMSPLIKLVNVSREEDIIQKELRPVDMAAVFAGRDRGCMAGTRTAILAQLLGWADDPTAVPVFFLRGPAGSGKTAIAQSFCDSVHAKGIFAPSFFCSRRTSVDDYQDVMRIVPTLSALMARRYPLFMSTLLAQLSSLKPDREPLSLPIKEQLLMLIQVPLTTYSDEPLPAILVIDGLDELKDQGVMGEFLVGLLSVADLLPVRFLLTSRSEDEARFRLPDPPSRLHSILRLHDLQEDVVTEDIRLYLRQKLHEAVGRFHNEESGDFQHPWPTDSQLEQLVTLTNTSFIYASAVVKYLMEEDPERRLQALLNGRSTIAIDL